MKLRPALIVLSCLAISFNSLVAVSADQPGTHSSENSGENFQNSGLRSHGFPVRNWQDLAQGAKQGSSESTPSTVGDQQNGDLNWLSGLSASLKQAKQKGGGGGGGGGYVVGGPASNPISCHNTCATLTGTIALIPVWVGAWASADLTKWNTVLGNIVTSLGAAPANSIAKAGHVFNTNTLYFTSKTKVAPSLQWVTNTSITAPTATKVSDANVATDINTFISANSKIVPAGTTPIYMYIGAKTTLLTSGFGTAYCGWHSYGTTSTLKNVQYLAIQDFTSTYFGNCSAQLTSPNGSVSLDAMASVLTHEIDETITDPFLNAWFDGVGAENADKCAWTFGTLSSTGSSYYNVTLGSLKYLIQQNWLANNLVTATGLSTGAACSITG
jgi:Phosphate-induced protein 1 conserved region